MEQIKASLRSLTEDVHSIRDDLKADLNGIRDDIAKAYPAGDADGHRRYHEMMIEDLEAKKKLTQAIKEKTISGLIWAGIIALSMAAWHELQRVLVLPR